MRLACVVHRFGAELAGGSEAHCRQVAQRLAERHEVTILTTCAQDHISWRNAYPPGESTDGALRVVRFPVARQRSLHRFRDISELAFRSSALAADQQQWFRENGPDSPALVDALRASGSRYDRVLFWAFRYATSYFGLPHVADRAVLVPTAEDDAVIRMDALASFFALPAGFLFLTPEEQELVETRAAGPLAPSAVIGSGLEPAGAAVVVPLDGHGITGPFVLYLGRIDPNKGCQVLLDHFLRYRAERDTPVDLVMAGPENMPMPDDPHVKRLGFVEPALRDALLSQAAALVVPSPFESLSLVLLEGWNHALPALVNGRCRVLKGQALRADGALYYDNYDEFAYALDYLLQHPPAARQLGQQGLAYVNAEYRWPHVIAKIEDLLQRVGPAAALPA